MRERLGYTPPEEKKGTVESGHKAQWEAWQKEGRERFNAARRDHERASQEYLVKAEQEEAAEQLYQVFLDAKFWHHQEDIIKQAGLARNQKNFEFYHTLKCVVCKFFGCSRIHPHTEVCGFLQNS